MKKVFNLPFMNQSNHSALHEWKYLQNYNPKTQIEFHRPNNGVNPRTGRKWMHLVYMINRPMEPERNKLLTSNFENIVSKWDAISTSLISNVLLEAYGSIGYILDVPPQNIISTNEADISFKNHIGTTPSNGNFQRKVIDSFALVDYINKTQNRKIVPPKVLIEKTMSFSEVIIVGKAGISIYPNLPPTGEIKAKGIYLMDGNYVDGKKQEMYKLAKRASEVNNLPIIYVKDPMFGNSLTMNSDV
ncbi:hypothetical protein [Fluviispira sanaruensis]|uniref:Uncharacterized protein n=1 Tax=Fluviispira sanaruensis TaxID=2493639 RepID=A0A4V0P2W4_FLUSA|nr:hypothetical protein [Fluviispira sanaruensis]BBH54637.1 hypothetical protein JCM31447_31110 [Fluviispira sanaruensis]